MADSEIRAQYLTLALRSRRLIDSLIRYVDKGESAPTLRDELQSAMESIEAVNSNENVLALFSRLNPNSLFSHYEQLRLIDEVKQEVGDPEISAKISHFIAADTAPANRTDDALHVLRFFGALEARALNGYNLEMQAARM